jgi:hypothetical protein
MTVKNGTAAPRLIISEAAFNNIKKSKIIY